MMTIPGGYLIRTLDTAKFQASCARNVPGLYNVWRRDALLTTNASSTRTACHTSQHLEW